jgi:hypothetical protein
LAIAPSISQADHPKEAIAIDKEMIGSKSAIQNNLNRDTLEIRAVNFLPYLVV